MKYVHEKYSLPFARYTSLWRLTALLALILWGSMAAVYAQPADFVDEQFAGPFDNAVGLTFDNNGRMFVWERKGAVWIVENGVKSAQPLIDISEEVGNWRDFGLLGFALDPDFLSNGYIYLLYIVDRHHLMNFGTSSYNPNTDEYFNATIGRITRYQARASTNFSTVDYSTRKILLGETPSTGFPNLHQSHGTGHLVFGTDGTLLASFGDGASYSSTDQGSASETYYQQAIADGIIPASHNIGAYRSQLLSSLAGKIVRLDPNTGDGIYNNPYYDANNPRSPESRTWALGLRNPCRFSKKPGSGSHDIDDADPGIFYIGDVGWGSREEMSVCDGPGLNFGWPKYEGMTHQPGYNNASYAPSSHAQPKLDWRTGSARALVNGSIVNIGSGTVPGPSFTGNCSIGGVWYTGDDFPTEYKNTYFHADYGGDWIRNFGFDGQDNPTFSRDFKQNADRIIYIGTDPNQGGIYYLTVGGGNYVRKFRYSPGNLPPLAQASSNVISGNSPLAVQLQGSLSADPDGDNLSFSWNFGDGSPVSTEVNPIHTFTASGSAPTQYTVTLTVTDPGGLTDQASFQVYLNNTPPEILSTSLDNIDFFSHTNPTTLNLSATVVDAEHATNELEFEWTTALYHSDHNHNEPPDNSPTTSTMVSPIGCDGTTYWYRITLKVTDPAGLSATYYKDLQPDCPGTPQSINFGPIEDKLTTDPSFTVSPTVSSGLPIVLFLVSGPATISGNTITLIGQPGEVIVRATQPGNPSYAPAEAVDQVFQVNYPNQFGDCASVLIQQDDFEGGYGNWIDGGEDANRVNNASFANSGSFSIELRDNNATSVISTNNLDLSNYAELRVDFSYITNSFDSGSEDFWLQLSTNGGSSYTTVEEWNLGDEFQNGQRKNESITLSGPFSSNTRVRFRCDATANGDQVYLDDIVLYGCIPNANQPPVASFTATPSSGPAPLVASFDASGSTDPENNPLNFVWNFGDGNTATGETATHTFTNPGSYTITLVVNDGSSFSETSQTLDVQQAGACPSPQNLALNQVVEQSSTYGAGNPELAVDGNTTGSSPWTADLQHTQNQFQPWWQVDLGQLSQIDQITVFNRSDAFQDRLKDFYVCISNTEFSPSASISELLSNSAITVLHFPGVAGALENFAPDVEGRYVRIQLGGNGILHLAEVEVIGCPAGNDPCNGASPVEILTMGPFLENAGIQQLQASPAGGTWGGDAASNGQFDPGQGPGTYSVSYTFTDGNGCTQTDNQEIVVNPVGGCSTPTNLALNKNAQHSSTYGVGYAFYANDGNTSGSSAWSADLQHTQSESQPWWEVDLGAESQIDQVKIYNRTDCCQARLQNFYVLISSTPFSASSSLNDLLADPTVFSRYFSGVAGTQEGIALNAQGQYVRIQLAGSGILHMAEVEVLGCSEVVDPCLNNGSTNLALGGNAEQSSIYGFGIASVGVDGDTEGDRGPWGNASILHTQRENQPWWQVDLGQQGDVQEVTIYNRTDCCQGRLRDFYILLSDTPFPNSASLSSLLGDPGVESRFFAGAAGDLETIAFNGAGRYLRLQLSVPNEILHVAEVEVTGCPTASSASRFQNPGLPVAAATENGPQLTVYPSPANEKTGLTVRLNTPQTGLTTFELINLQGQSIMRLQVNKMDARAEYALPVPNLASGVYLLKASGMDWHLSKQVMID